MPSSTAQLCGEAFDEWERGVEPQSKCSTCGSQGAAVRRCSWGTITGPLACGSEAVGGAAGGGIVGALGF